MYRESIFNLYDNSGVSTAKIVSIHSTKRKFIRIGDYVTVFPQKYKLNKKHIKQKQKYTGLVIGMRRWLPRLNGTYFKSDDNKLVLFTLGGKFLGTRVYGFIYKELRRGRDEGKPEADLHKIFLYAPVTF